ncbi:MAG: biotin/lipoyl-binding protein [Calditrichia bacterium]
MKEYIITINNRTYQVVVKKIKTDTAIVEVDGKEYEVGVERKIKNPIAPLDVKPVKTQASPASSPADTLRPFSAEVKTGNKILSPLPGLILEILVTEGEKIQMGQTIMKMEAMKMENEIKSHAAGKIKQIYVKPGDSVLENTPLLEIEG